MDFSRKLLTLNHAVAFVDALLREGWTLHRAGGRGRTHLNPPPPHVYDKATMGDLLDRRDDLDRMNWRPRGFRDAVDYANKQSTPAK